MHVLSEVAEPVDALSSTAVGEVSDSNALLAAIRAGPTLKKTEDPNSSAISSPHLSSSAKESELGLFGALKHALDMRRFSVQPEGGDDEQDRKSFNDDDSDDGSF